MTYDAVKTDGGLGNKVLSIFRHLLSGLWVSGCCFHLLVVNSCWRGAPHSWCCWIFTV